MERPQWNYRRGKDGKAHPTHVFRGRGELYDVERQYRTLDINPEDVDNFFHMTGRLEAEPAWDEMTTYAQYRRASAVEECKARRVAAIAAHVRDYLCCKEWRRRLRVASADLEWVFEPYRKQKKMSDLDRLKRENDELERYLKSIGG